MRSRKRVVETLCDVFDAQSVHPRRSQLDRERNAVKPTTDEDHGSRSLHRDPEVGYPLSGPIDEQLYGLVPSELLIGCPDGGNLETLNPTDDFSWYPERLPACGQDA